MNNLINAIATYCVNYFEISTKVARKEFNFGILVYSILFIGSLYLVTDVDAMKNVMNTTVQDVQHQVYNGQMSQEDAALIAMNEIKPLAPTLFMSTFALLLLPLYIRRLNDTIFHTIGFAAPIVVLYSFDVIYNLFGLTWVIPLYDAMSFYTFFITAILCVIPSKEEEREDY